MLNIGIIGLGKMGLLHAGILNALPCTQVTSIAEKEGVLTRFAKNLLPNFKFYSSVEQMLTSESELDAIYVTTPIISHLPIIEEIAESRRKVALFVEKPLAVNTYDAKRIIDISKKIGTIGMVGFQKRFSPIFRRGREMLEDGILGELTSFSAYSYVSSVFSEGKGWRFKKGQGGALLDLGPHLIDTLLWYFGEPSKVVGVAQSIYSKDVDDCARAKMKFDSGLEGRFEISWSIEGYRLPEISIEISGKNGSIRVTDDYLKVEILSDVAMMKAGKYHFKKPEFNSHVDFLIGDPEYCIEDKHFVKCLLENKVPQTDFAAGAKVNEVIELVLSSENHCLVC